MLAFHPGALTRRYIDGERARFVSPIALFLFSVFLLFAVVSNLPGWSLGDGAFLKSGLAGGMADAREKLVEEREAAVKSAERARRVIAEERAEAAPDAKRIARNTEQLRTAERAVADLTGAEKLLRRPPDGTREITTSNGVQWAWLDERWKHAKENPKLLLYKLKTSAYKYSWALIPFSLPFLWVLFPFSRRFGLYDHAVFATYSLTFMSLLAVVLALLGWLGVSAALLILAATLIPVVHIYKQLKGTYLLSRAGAVVRTMLLTSAIFWLIVPAFALSLVALGLTG